MKKYAFLVGSEPDDRGLFPLLPLPEHEAVVMGVHKVQVRVTHLSLGDQTIVGTSDTLGVSVAGVGARELCAAQMRITGSDRAPMELRSLHANFTIDSTPSPIAFAMVLDRGATPEQVERAVAKILADTDLVRETETLVTDMIPRSVGCLGGFAASAALWFVDRLVDTVTETLFGQHLLLAEKVSLIYDDDSSVTRLQLAFASLPLFDDLTTGDGYTLDDFGIDPKTSALMWNRKSHPRRGWQESSHPFALVEALSHH